VREEELKLKNSTRHYLLLLIFITTSHQFNMAAYAGDYIDDVIVSPKTVEEIEGPLEHGLKLKEKLGVKYKKRLEELPEFLQDSSLTTHFRSYDFSRDTESESDPGAFAIGGEIRFLSGLLKDTFRIGASYYLSHGIHEDEGEQTLLLTSGAGDINTLGELYLSGTVDEYSARLYRQSFSLPYLNKQDSRMVPNTHEAYVIQYDGKQLDSIAGHVTKIKKRDEQGFTSMAEAAGATKSSKGTFMAGARYNINSDTNIGAINYFTDDVFNIFYSEFNFTHKLTKEFSTKITGQFTHQKSVGETLIGEFDTNHYGLQLKASYRQMILTLAATNTGSGAAITSPFGGRPGFLSLMISDFDRANEQGLLAGLSYDFSRWGLPGLSSFAKIAWGNDAEDASSGQNLPDLSEYNLTIDYKPETSLLNGLWLRLRHARSDFEGGAYTKDSRVILNYELLLY
jgi:hypothetical protein